MNRIAIAAAATLLAAGFAATGPAAATPAPDDATPDIVGGTRAPATPWAVQLVFEQSGGTYGCSGEQINASWVLTANHCVDGTTSMDVYHSNSTANPGRPLAADKLYSAPKGDVALVHLSKAYTLKAYPSLNLSYAPKSTGAGTIMGYGLRANSQESDGLYQAGVNLVGRSSDAYDGTAQHLKGRSGAANHGDSGGPLLVNGKIVGVCSTGDTADPGANIHAGSNYAVLSQSAAWLKKKAGL